MSQFFVAAQNGGAGAVTSVTGGNSITVSPTTGATVVNVSGTTNHAVLLGNATGSINSLTPIGTTGQILTSNGPGVDPSWQSAVTPMNSYVNVTHAMSPYTVLATDFFISVDATGGSVTILLPNGPSANEEYVVKDRLGQSSINTITVTTVGGTDTIDGSTTYIFTDPYESIDLLFHGTNYEIF